MAIAIFTGTVVIAAQNSSGRKFISIFSSTDSITIGHIESSEPTTFNTYGVFYFFRRTATFSTTTYGIQVMAAVSFHTSAYGKVVTLALNVFVASIKRNVFELGVVVADETVSDFGCQACPSSAIRVTGGNGDWSLCWNLYISIGIIGGDYDEVPFAGNVNPQHLIIQSACL